jgi:hypothetical protein
MTSIRSQRTLLLVGLVLLSLTAVALAFSPVTRPLLRRTELGVINDRSVAVVAESLTCVAGLAIGQKALSDRSKLEADLYRLTGELETGREEVGFLNRVATVRTKEGRLAVGLRWSRVGVLQMCSSSVCSVCVRE